MSFEKVVVGYDGSSHADRAIDAAGDQVGSDGMVHVVTAYQQESNRHLIEHLQQLPEEFRYVYNPAADEEKRQHAALERLRDRGVQCAGHIVADDPATAILDVARRERSDLVVVGSRGLGGVHRFLRGSVSTRVATHAPMSVLVVHEPGDSEPS